MCAVKRGLTVCLLLVSLLAWACTGRDSAKYVYACAHACVRTRVCVCVRACVCVCSRECANV